MQQDDSGPTTEELIEKVKKNKTASSSPYISSFAFRHCANLNNKLCYNCFYYDYLNF